MKGPSLDAIRRFKEQQEQKKREETERKIAEKLNTLEHRSVQGDRKAKSELKKIRNQIDKPPPPPTSTSQVDQHDRSHRRDSSRSGDSGAQSRLKSKPKAAAETFNFDELMKMAKQNNNQIREKPQPPPPPEPEPVRIPKKKATTTMHSGQNSVMAREPVRQHYQQPPRHTESTRSNGRVAALAPPAVSRDFHTHSRNVAQPTRNISPKGPPPSRSNHSHFPPLRNFPPQRPHMTQLPRGRFMPSTSRHHDEDEDDYESDGFVVSDGEDDARAELTATLKSVFRYDRRRCDLREEELDRQYRAIGNVSTFEDLEREERRASRLAAIEDARALREEEERKRLKKLRLDQALKEERKKSKKR